MRFNTTKCTSHEDLSGPSKSYNYSHVFTQQHHSQGSQHAKYLGVTITDNLNWSQQISSIIGKANSKIAFLWRNLHPSPRELWELAHCALIHSVIEYSTSVWDPHLRKDVDLLENIQCRAACFVTGDLHHMSSVTSICCKTLIWQTQGHLTSSLLQGCKRSVCHPYW